jgi:signal transduction histidine kinase
MNTIKKIFNRSYYKLRIILIFSIFTIALVLITSRVNYIFVRDLYLEQLKEQVNNSSRLVAEQIDKTFLNLIQIGTPIKPTQVYFQDIFNRYIKIHTYSQVFLFDKNFSVLVHSNKNYLTGNQESQLLFNKKEILELRTNQSTTSLPFKGDDGKWYLWSFYRLNDSVWLCLQESAYRLEKVEDFSNTFWYIGFAGIIITIILSWFVAQSISKPVDSLVKFSSEIGKGNLSFPTPGNLKGEMSILSNALEKMRNDLSTSQKDKENMLAQIAHEIRNPLGGIELLANLTKEDLNKGNKNPEYIERILKEINGLKTLISVFLDYSRPAAANQSWVNIQRLILEIKNLIQDKLKDKNIQLTYEDNIKNIYFDEEHLKHIIMNLLYNSIESVSNNGRINIEVKQENNKWEIIISDNGNGMQTADFSKIFEPFYTTKKNGTGLGLSICKKLSHENNAELIFEKNKDLTTFKIIKEVINES